MGSRRVFAAGLVLTASLAPFTEATTESYPIEQAKLLPSDGAAEDDFGAAVSHSGDSVIIGAAGADDFGHRSGAVYVFQRTSGEWAQQAYINGACQRL